MTEARAVNDALVLEVEALAARYANSVVLHGVDLQLTRGEWLGLVGPNGSGKSTLLACIAGRHPPAAGRVLVGGQDIVRASVAARQELGFAVDPGLLPALLTGRQCLEVFASARGMAAPDETTLQLAGALQFAAALALPVSHYSYGMRQKLAVLLALLGNPPLILLDEAFNGLDPRSSLVLQHALRARVTSGGTAVLLATHALNIVERCATRAALLLEGRLVRHWRADELASLRNTKGGLEVAMAEAVQRSNGDGAPP